MQALWCLLPCKQESIHTNPVACSFIHANAFCAVAPHDGRAWRLLAKHAGGCIARDLAWHQPLTYPGTSLWA